MTHGTIAGILLTDLIQGHKNKWEDLYSPSRIRLKSLPEYASENINVEDSTRITLQPVISSQNQS